MWYVIPMVEGIVISFTSTTTAGIVLVPTKNENCFVVLGRTIPKDDRPQIRTNSDQVQHSLAMQCSALQFIITNVPLTNQQTIF